MSSSSIHSPTGIAAAPSQQVISISYLGLTREQPASGEYEAGWASWYAYFPWEDHRLGPPAMIEEALAPSLQRLGRRRRPDAGIRQDRSQRAAITFGLEARPWNEELVLQRYELLFEARLIPEARRGGKGVAREGAQWRAARPGAR